MQRSRRVFSWCLWLRPLSYRDWAGAGARGRGQRRRD